MTAARVFSVISTVWGSPDEVFFKLAKCYFHELAFRKNRVWFHLVGFLVRSFWRVGTLSRCSCNRVGQRSLFSMRIWVGRFRAASTRARIVSLWITPSNPSASENILKEFVLLWCCARFFRRNSTKDSLSHNFGKLADCSFLRNQYFPTKLQRKTFQNLRQQIFGEWAASPNEIRDWYTAPAPATSRTLNTFATLSLPQLNKLFWDSDAHKWFEGDRIFLH